MRTRRILRFVLVVVAVAIGGVIWWQWRPLEADDGAAVELELPEDREVASRSEGLRVTQSANGLLVFQLEAAQQVDFVDGWNVYDAVELRIPTAGAETEADAGEDPVPTDPCGADGCIRIRADTLRASGRVPNFDELRFIGNVVVAMPGELEFETRRLDYDPVTGVVSNCNRNELRYAGLDVRADCLRFETGGDVARDRRLRARELEMWGDLVVETSTDASSLPPGLSGGAERMRFLPDSEEVSLLDGPRLDLARARVVGEEISLALAGGARRLERIRATGDAAIDWTPPGGLGGSVGDTAAGTPVDGSDADPGGADGSAAGSAETPQGTGEEGTAPAEGPISPVRQSLRGDIVVLELGDAEGSETVLAWAREGGVASLDVEGTGGLQAREISVVGSGEGRARVSAVGAVVWRSEGEGAPVPRLDAGTLVLELEAGGLRGLQAMGAVVAAVAAADEAAAGAAREFRGERLELEWDPAGELRTGAWPEGVTFVDGERTLRAAQARRDPQEPAWSFDGSPRPSVSDALFRLEAEELHVADGGDLTAEGEVVGEIDAGRFGAGAALFGDVERVRVRSEQATLGREGDLRLSEDVRVLWREQSLVANRLLVIGEPGRLQATGDVELVIAGGDTAPGGPGDDGERGDPPGEGGSGTGLLVASGRALLVDGDPAEIRLAGDATVEIGERRIASERIAISPGAEGGWRRFTAEESVEFEAPLGRGSGVRLDYDLDLQELILEGKEETPARFGLAEEERAEDDSAGERAGGRGVRPSYESTGALRIRWLEETVEIAAIEDGRTRTSVVPREQEEGASAPS